MTPQELADELARLAGWNYVVTPGFIGWIHKDDPECFGATHPFPIGSLDALEAFRREKLPKWELRYVQHHTGKPALIDPTRTWWVQVSKGNNHVRSTGIDEWTARASALVAAAREETK